MVVVVQLELVPMLISAKPILFTQSFGTMNLKILLILDTQIMLTL